MFSTQEFIDASRKFVCIRIETFENQESKDLVQMVLNGRYANTSFAIFDPTGEKMLTRGGRSPGMVMSNDGGRSDTSGRENPELISKMSQIARRYRPSGDSTAAELQDFNSIRQALNCASADQRLLVLVDCGNEQRSRVNSKLKSIFADKDIIGKFHLNFVDPQTDSGWTEIIKGSKKSPGLMVIRSSQFGLDGKIVAQVELGASHEKTKAALLQANDDFAKTEKRKDYEQHVRQGRQQRIVFEDEISREGTSDGRNRSTGRTRRPGR